MSTVAAVGFLGDCAASMDTVRFGWRSSTPDSLTRHPRCRAPREHLPFPVGEALELDAGLLAARERRAGELADDLVRDLGGEVGGAAGTLAATPARWAVVTAKAIAVGVVTFASGFVATVLAMLAAAPILDKSTGGLLASSARSAAALALTALVVLGLGAVLRSTAGTIFTAVAVLFAPAILSGVVTNEIVTTVLDYLPSDLSGAVAAGSGEPYGPWGAAALLAAWGVAMLSAGTFLLDRRDS
jgi:hypothetical protein